MLHDFKRFVDPAQWLPMGDEFIHFEITLQIVVDQTR
jgi:hypothetical protein